MRFIGYLLLYLGFASIPILHQARLHVSKYEALASSLPPGSETRTYDLNEVSKIVHAALDKMGNSFPPVSFSTVVMLVGGIMLDLANRRSRKAQAAA